MCVYSISLADCLPKNRTFTGYIFEVMSKTLLFKYVNFSRTLIFCLMIKLIINMILNRKITYLIDKNYLQPKIFCLIKSEITAKDLLYLQIINGVYRVLVSSVCLSVCLSVCVCASDTINTR